MSTGKLVLTPLRKAIESLAEVIAKPKDEFIRDATIQRFEYTYELCWKMIKRHLTWAGFPDTPPTVRELFREAAKIGIITDAEKWFDFHQARNETSHTYDENTAEEVYTVALAFLSDAQALLANLTKYHG